jgi:hypothetical protein
MTSQKPQNAGFFYTSMTEPPAKRVRLDETALANGNVPEKKPDPLSLESRLSQHSSDSAEQLVGISAYVNPAVPAFESAIIKHRFTDFMVWEISKAGKVVKLENIERPETKTVLSEEAKQDDESTINLEDHMTNAKVEELQAFVQAGKSANAKLYSDVGTNSAMECMRAHIRYLSAHRIQRRPKSLPQCCPCRIRWKDSDHSGGRRNYRYSLEYRKCSG